MADSCLIEWIPEIYMKDPQVFENVTPAEILPTWIERDKERWNKKRLSDSQNSTGMKQIDKSIQWQTLANLPEKEGLLGGQSHQTRGQNRKPKE